jgi:hypothetical protein
MRPAPAAVPEKPLEQHPAVPPEHNQDVPLDPEVAPPPSEQPQA